MRKILVTILVNEGTVIDVSGCDNLSEAISKELGWINDSGLSVENIKDITDEPTKLTLDAKGHSLTAKVVKDEMYPRIQIENEDDIIAFVEINKGKIRTLGYKKDEEEPTIVEY